MHHFLLDDDVCHMCLGLLFTTDSYHCCFLFACPGTLMMIFAFALYLCYYHYYYYYFYYYQHLLLLLLLLSSKSQTRQDLRVLPC